MESNLVLYIYPLTFIILYLDLIFFRFDLDSIISKETIEKEMRGEGSHGNCQTT